jgi:dihydrofolate synthase/folylpolyglutamate synthase
MLNKKIIKKLRIGCLTNSYVSIQGASAYKKDLTNTHLLIDHLSNPHKSKMRSCCWYKWQGLYLPYASIYTSRGGQVGLYTSPHLKDFRSALK